MSSAEPPPWTAPSGATPPRPTPEPDPALTPDGQPAPSSQEPVAAGEPTAPGDVSNGYGQPVFPTPYGQPTPPSDGAPGYGQPTPAGYGPAGSSAATPAGYGPTLYGQPQASYGAPGYGQPTPPGYGPFAAPPAGYGPFAAPPAGGGPAGPAYGAVVPPHVGHPAPGVPNGPARRRHPGRWIVAAVVVVVLVATVAIGGVVALSARARYSQVAAMFDTTVSQLQAADTERATAVSSASDVETSAAAITKLDLTGFVDGTAASTLAKDLPALTKALAATRDPLVAPERPASPSSLWPPTLDQATTKLQHQVDSMTATIESADKALATLASTSGKVTADQDALLGSVATVSAQVDAANEFATNETRFSFEDAAKDVGPDALDPPGALSTYVQAGQVLLASQAAEQAQLAGPLHDKMVAVEQFARSIDGGVRLDFTWAPTLTFDGNTWGLGGSSGGWTQFWFSRGGYATISLTDSVAAQWPTSKALVVHEVGHAISTKCESMAPHDTRAEVEAWAVAWAISMGYTGAGNGADLYGTPPASLIATAKTCR